MKQRVDHYQRYTDACDASTEVLDVSGTFDGIAFLHPAAVIRSPDGTVISEGTFLRIEGRHYRVTDKLTGVLADDIAKCLRQFASDLMAAADEYERTYNRFRGLPEEREKRQTATAA